MRTRVTAVLGIAMLLVACQMATRTVKPTPLDSEGEVWVYLEPLPARAVRLRFSVAAVAATRADGSEVPLELVTAEASGADTPRQVLLARGRIPAGDYAGLSIRVAKATLAADEGPPARLLVPSQAVRVGVPLGLSRGRARVVSLSLQYERSVDKGFGFTPAFLAEVPEMPLVELLGYVTATGSDAVTVFDKKTRRVVAVLPTGRDPRGLVVDRLERRLYVALSGTDEVECLDLLTGAELGRARLLPGDRPQEVALAADGRLLVTTNAGSSTVSFVDPRALVEVGRARTGMQPTSLLVDRSGRRAYAFNQGASTITVLDLTANDLTAKGVAATIATEGAPARGAFNRAGDRLYVVSPGSAYMSVFSVPGYAKVNQLYVGFGAISVHVDPRTDYAYVGMGDSGELQVFAPMTPLPIARIELQGPATWLAIDDSYDRMLLVMPSTGGVAFLELTSRKVLPALDAGTSPYAAAVVGERP